MISLDRIEQQIQIEKAASRVTYLKNQNARPTRERLAEEANRKFFDEHKEALLAEALAKHPVRFQPLQEILDQFKGFFGQLRDKHFPGSRIFFVDSYHYLYPPGKGSNYYQRTMALFENELYSKENPPPKFHGPQRLLGIHAIAREPLQNIWFVGPVITGHPRFFLGVDEKNVPHSSSEDKDFWEQSEKTVSWLKDDFQNITPQEDLFHGIFGNFSTQGNTMFIATPPDKNIMGYESAIDSFKGKGGPRDFRRIESHLVKILRHNPNF